MPYGVFGAERVRYSYATCKYERACKEITLGLRRMLLFLLLFSEVEIS